MNTDEGVDLDKVAKREPWTVTIKRKKFGIPIWAWLILLFGLVTVPFVVIPLGVCGLVYCGVRKFLHRGRVASIFLTLAVLLVGMLIIGVLVPSESNANAGGKNECKSDAKLQEKGTADQNVDDFSMDPAKVRAVMLDDSLYCRSANECGFVNALGDDRDAETFSQLKEQAERGDAMAQFKLAVCYVNEIGTPTNFTAAALYAKKSFDQGCGEGKSLWWDKGLCLDGFGGNGKNDRVTRDQAVKWLDEAAENGVVHAQYLSGRIHRELKDRELGRKNLIAAARGGSKLAKVELSNWFANEHRYGSSDPNFPIPSKEAISNIMNLAQENFIPALLEKAWWHRDGVLTNFGVEDDAKLAVAAYTNAVAQGSVSAASRLGAFYAECVRFEKAWTWLCRAKKYGGAYGVCDRDAYQRVQYAMGVLGLYRNMHSDDLSDRSLVMFAYEYQQPPKEGLAYLNISYGFGLKIWQEIGRRKYLVISEASDATEAILVETERDNDVDSHLRDGVYINEGQVEYKNFRGATRRVWAFREAKLR